MSFWKNNFLLIILRACIRALVAVGNALKGGARAVHAWARTSPRLAGVLKRTLVSGYDLLLKLRKSARAIHPGGKMHSLMAHPSSLRGILVSIILVVIVTNLHARTRAAEDLGRDSLLYTIVTADAHAIVVDAVPASVRPSPLQAGDVIRREDSLAEDDATADYPYALALSSGALLRPNPVETLRGTRPRDGIVTYVVQANDTISGIAYRFTLAVNTILWANNLRATALIRPGDELVIPPMDGVLHTVKKGETLSAIASRYRADRQKILAANNLADAAALTVGRALMIPEGRPPAAPRPAIAAARPATTIGAQGMRIAGNGLLWPTPGRTITQYFSWRHGGLDIDGTTASPIFAAEDGVVETAQAGWNGGYGTVIVIDHGRGVKTRYGHLSRLFVKRGDRVERGQTVGMVGSTGRSTGSHVHFEVLINGVRKNPLSYL